MRKWDIRKWGMREWNLALGCLILVCSLGVSYFHTKSMYIRAGADNLYEANALTIATELNFLLAVANKLYARSRRKKVSGFVHISFAIGICLIAWSNGTAWSNITWSWNNGIDWTSINWEGATLGLCIPVLLWMSEGIISNQLLTQTERIKEARKISVKQNASDSTVSKKEPVRQESSNSIVPKIEPVRQEPDKPTIVKETRQTNRINHLLNEADNQSPDIIAKRLKLQIGDWPSIRHLADEAGVSRYQAEKTLKELKGAV